MKKNKDMEIAISTQRQIAKKNFIPSLSSRIGNFFYNTLLFILTCLVIIFRPLNILMIGIIISIFLIF